MVKQHRDEVDVIEEVAPDVLLEGCRQCHHVLLQRSANTEIYLTQCVFKVGLQKSIPTQIRQLILYISDIKG